MDERFWLGYAAASGVVPHRPMFTSYGKEASSWQPLL